jgi:FlaA1/EpsC-like NDP-sugar epimerase
MRKILKKMAEKLPSRWTILLIDVYLVTQSFVISYIIEFNFYLEFRELLFVLPLVAIVGFISFILTGFYKGTIRHNGFKDAVTVFLEVSLFSFLLTVIYAVNRYYIIEPRISFPFSVIIVQLMLNIIVLISTRYLFKYVYSNSLKKGNKSLNILIYGAGDSGASTYSVLNEGAAQNTKVIGYIDDNPSKIGKKINQVKIYGPDDISKEFIEKHQIKQVIITIQHLKAKRILEISNQMISKSLKVKIVPPAEDWIDGNLHEKQICDVRIEDLLGRKVITIENTLLKKEFSDKVILVTGAAGSIGSEIARQVSSYNYKKLIFIDQAESALFDLQQEFVEIGKKKTFFILADIRGERRMNKIIGDHKPDIIFHAAAYKHVPLMEENAYEAVNVNVVGTHIIMNLAMKFNVEKFVMVSTDKAVNPTNVMGATKRIAEMYARSVMKEGKTKFITTRFGNVLGSNGSVIPIFKRQIKVGGPITVTHKDITRYFMTIPEACQLVLEAGAMGKGGEIYVFDMGDSIKIFDLAVNMIQLSGLNYPEDIDIKISGLRPGEKIYEELLATDEDTIPTYHQKIMIAKLRDFDEVEMKNKILELCELSKGCNDKDIVSFVKQIVPEYKSENSKFEKLDVVLKKIV